jgi:hypothetical protein
LRGESFTCYGSDFRDIITYNFNNQGYRSDFDFELDDASSIVAVLGSSIATGHGLDLEDSFASIVAQKLEKKLWNLGQGCFRSSNQTILEQVQFLADSELNIDYYVLQFTHINRQGNKFNTYLELDQAVAVQNFEAILAEVSQVLAGRSWCWMLMDFSGAEFSESTVNHPNKIAIDPDIIDHISVSGYEDRAPSTHALKMLSLHPGPEWHKETADQIIKFFL